MFELSVLYGFAGRLGERLGMLAGIDMIRLNRAIVVFLGLASPG